MTIESRLASRLQSFKTSYEGTSNGSPEKKISRIRSGKLIGIIEDWCREELINEGILASYISTIKATGFFKTKSQDVGVRCIKRCKEHRNIPPLAINVRSQLSSINKNYDTLYERVLAEALNLHEADPNHVSGFLWLMPLWGYEQKKHKSGTISRSEDYDRSKYITSLNLLDGRKSPDDSNWKFERMCMLLVDFSQAPPKPILGHPHDHLDQYLFPNLDIQKEWKCLDYRDFFKTLVSAAKSRHGECIPVKRLNEFR